jgi:hypothetical protein
VKLEFLTIAIMILEQWFDNLGVILKYKLHQKGKCKKMEKMII